jgi:hypothetical protein
MKRVIFLGLLMMSCIGLNSQTLPGGRTATYFYIVNFDNNLNELFKLTGSEVSSSIDLVEGLNKKFTTNIIDTFYTIASEKFKTELGLELKPLSELTGKVKYNKSYPDCPSVDNVKKVIKSVSGYQYFVDYYVNVFSENSDNPESSLSPSIVKPIYAISFTLYDTNGKTLKQIQLCYRAKKSLAKTHKMDKSTHQEIKSELCSFYSEALDQVAMVYKRI